MPYHKQTYKFGNLFIVFKVKFPESINEVQRGKVSEALAFQQKKGKDENMDVADTCIMKPFTEEHKNTHHEGGKEGNSSD
jgi:DnaJ-class molecular chaperone